MGILGAQQLFDLGKSKVKLTIVFEVVDDPEDSVESRGCLKPVNVWFFFSEKSHELPLKAEDFHKAEHVTFVPSITKQTGLDARKFAWLNTGVDGAYLHVLAEPAPGWTGRYEARQYKLQVSVGRYYNIAVSLQPVADSANAAANQEGKPARARAQGFKL